MKSWASKPTLGSRLLVDHQTYGTLCFIGKEPHEGRFTEADKDFLMLMTRWVEEELEREHSGKSSKNQ